MAKKTDTTKPAAPAAANPPAKRATKPAPKKKLVAKAPKLPAVKATKPAAKTTKATKAVKPAKPAYTTDDVALRAYFIAEKRHAHGIPGSEHGDWLEAERQLIAEAAKPKKAKTA